MARFSLWDPRKNEDYQFMDDTILEMFEAGATSVFVHKYLGPQDVSDGSDATLPRQSNGLFGNTEVNIQDLLFLENRDRNYAPDVYELLGVYNLQDTEFDVRQFGIFLEADTLYLEFHLNDSIARLGRKIMPGDVLELPHLRDDALLNENSPAVNKYYVVQDVNRAASGYSPTWFPHLIRVKVKPITDSQEYKQILDRPATDANGDFIPGIDLRDILSDYNGQIGVSEAIVAEAEKQVDRRNFETAHFYVVPGDECGSQYPWVFAGDGKPPNGAELAGSGRVFPDEADDGAWFLRTDMEPHVLFRKDGKMWRRHEVDYRKKWSAAHRILESFINNKNVTTVGNDTFAERQPLSKALKPRADF